MIVFFKNVIKELNKNLDIDLENTLLENVFMKFDNNFTFFDIFWLWTSVDIHFHICLFVRIKKKS